MDCRPLLPDGPVCYADGDGDGIVDPADVGLCRYWYGSTEDERLCRYDVDCDGTINPQDAGMMKFYYGPCTAESPPPCYMQE
jgi:hypothetical protein